MAAFAALAVWRATLGISFADDAHYAALPLRLAQGALPFRDEMTTQALGFLIVVPFVKLWTAFFGTTGLVLALRLCYVALATAVGYVVYRALRPSFGNGPSALAAWAPLLAPPYNIFGVSYNTMAILAFVAATALALAALRDDSRWAAGAAGVALGLGAVSYPPLSIGAACLAVCFVALARKPRLVLPFVGAAAVTALVLAAPFVLLASPGSVARASHYSSSVWRSLEPASRRASQALTNIRLALTRRRLLPMWVLAVVACLPWPKARAVACLLLPVAALLPALPRLMAGTPRGFFGAIGAAYLVVFAAGLVLPVVAMAIRERRRDVLLGLALATPLALVNFWLTVWLTSAAWYWGVSLAGLAPLVVVLVAAWARMLRDGGGSWTFGSGAACLLGVLVVMLFSLSFKDGAPLRLEHRFWHGPLAGIATTDQNARRISLVAQGGRRWVRAGDRVLVFNDPLAYLLVGGRIYTNAVWLEPGVSDSATIAYFRREGRLPDVAFVAQSLIARGVSGGRQGTDPLLSYLTSRYRVAGSAGPFVVYVPR